jgi:hypothetical protein
MSKKYKIGQRPSAYRFHDLQFLLIVQLNRAKTMLRGLDKKNHFVEASSASHNQADAAFFKGFPPFSFYKIEF